MLRYRASRLRFNSTQGQAKLVTHTTASPSSWVSLVETLCLLEEILFYPNNTDLQFQNPEVPTTAVTPTTRPVTKRPSIQAAVDLMIDMENGLEEEAARLQSSTLPVLRDYFNAGISRSAEDGREKTKKIMRVSEDLGKYMEDADILELRRDTGGRWLDLERCYNLAGLFD